MMIGDIPISPNMTYSSFDQARQEKMRQYTFERETNMTSTVSMAYLSANSTNAYIECLRSIRNQRGLYGYIAQGGPNDTSIMLHFVFNTAANDETVRKPEVRVVGGEIDNRALLETPFVGPRPFSVLLNRQNVDQDAIVNIILSSQRRISTGEIVASYDPADVWTISIPRRHRIYITRFEDSSVTGTLSLHAQGPWSGDCVEATPGHSFIIGQTVIFSDRPSSSTHVQSCTPHQPTITASRACPVGGSIRTNGGNDGSCNFEFSVMQRRPIREELN